jgi:hypothetical protein
VIESVLSYALAGFDPEFDPILDIYQTVFVQGRNAVATIAMLSVYLYESGAGKITRVRQRDSARPTTARAARTPPSPATCPAR